MQMTSHSIEYSVFNTISNSEEDPRISMMTQFMLLSGISLFHLDVVLLIVQ